MSVSVCPRVSVCVFVCPRSYLRNYTSDLYQIFCACYLWLLLGPLLAALSHILHISSFIDDVIFAYKLSLLDVAATLRH